MARLPDIAAVRDNLTAWYRPEVFAGVADGAVPAAWDDSGGLDFDLVVSGAVVKHNVLNGWPVLDFDGVNDLATTSGMVMSSLITSSLGTIFSVFKARTIATDLSGATIHNNDVVWSMAGLNRVGVSLRSSGSVNSYNYDGNYDSVASTITTGVWYVHMWRHGSAANQLYTSVDDALAPTNVGAGNTGSLADVMLLGNSATGATFADIQIAEWLSFNAALPNADAQAVVNYLLAKFGARGDAHEQARNLSSRHLWEFREPRLLLAVPGLPLAALDVDIGDEIAVVHPQIPNPAGLGAGPATWERLPLMVVESTPDFNSRTVTIVGESLRARRHTFYAAAEATKIPGQGLAISSPQPGNMLLVRRVPPLGAAGDGLAFVRRSSDGLVQEIGDGDLKIEPNGALCEIDGEQELASVGFSGGWTYTPPTGGSAAASDVATAGFQLFDSAVTTSCITFVRGTSGTGIAAEVSSTVIDRATGPADEYAIVQIDYRAENTSGLSWRLREGGGALRYWNNSTQAWQAGAVDNAIDTAIDDEGFPVDVAVAVGHYISKPITMEDTSGAAYNFEIRQATGVGSVGDEVNVFYAGLVQDSPAGGTKSRIRWSCSRIPATAVGTVRMGQDLGPLFPNHSGSRCFNAARGTGLIKIRPRFNSTDVANVDSTALKFTILHVYYDANNEWFLHYFRDSGGGVSQYRLDVKAAATTYRASLSSGVGAFNQVAVGWRWTSAADGELDLAARTVSLLVDGVRGTDVQAAAYPTESALAFMGVGVSANPTYSHYTLPLCGWWSSLELFDECLADAEIQAWSL